MSKELSKEHQVVVFARNNDASIPDYYESHEAVDSVEVHRINNTMRFPRYYEYDNSTIARSFEQFLRDQEPDVVHIQHLQGLSALLVPACRKYKIPIVFSLHDYWLLCRRMSLLRPNLELCSGPAPKKCQQCRFAEIDRYLVPSFLSKMINPVPNSVFSRLARQSSQRRLQETGNIADLLLLNHIARPDYLQALMRDVDIFVAPSRFVRDLFVKGVEKDRVMMIPHGIDTVRLPHSPKSPSSSMRFGYMGTVDRHKGVHVLIEAFNAFANRPNMELHIWGATPSLEYLKFLRRLNRNPNTKFEGVYSDPSTVLSQLDILVIPTVMYETYSIVAREALMSGTPVIAANIGAIPEVIVDHENGLLFKAGSADDLRTKINLLVDNPQMISQMATAIPPVQTIRQQVSQLTSLYQDLLHHDPVCPEKKS